MKHISYLFVLFALLSPAFAMGQQSVLDKQVVMLKDTGTVEELLLEIGNQGGFTFAYSNNLISSRIIILKSANQTVKAYLDEIFENELVSYILRGNKIILAKKETKDSFPLAHPITMSGYLKDSASGEALIGATVFIQELTQGTVSNSYGFYSVTMPEGTYTLVYSYIGYETQRKTLLLRESQHLNIELGMASTSLEEVMVTAENASHQVSSAEISTLQPSMNIIRKMPAFLGEVDILRSIVQLPGVSTVGEAAPGINVRGGSIDQNLILLDEAPVYNSSHLMGFYSVFNADAVKDVKLYKGGIPARYGGRLSSVLDITQKEGNNKEWKGSGGIGVVDSRFTLEGPLVKNRSSFIIAARRSYADLFLKHIKAAQVDQAYFYDINAKVNYTINEKNKVFLSGYLGRDVYRIGEDVAIDWGNITATGRWNHVFNKKLFSNVTAIYSKYIYRQGEPKGIYAYEGERSILNYNLKADFSYFINLKHQLTFGASSILYAFEPGKLKPVDISSYHTIDLPDEQALESSLYIGDEYTLNPRITLMAGLRYALYQNMGPGKVFTYQTGAPKSINTITDTLQYQSGEIIQQYGGFEPRISGSYLLNDHSSIKLSYNRTRQYLHFISNTTAATPVDFWKASNTYLKPEMADQLAAGYFRNFHQNRFQASVEVYYKRLDGLVDYRNGADLLLNETVETELVSGKGRAYGIELLVNKTKGRLTGWAGYTFSRTERLVKGSTLPETINQGHYYPANYDQPHKVNLVGVYEWNKKWTFSANFTYSTGRPITYPDGAYRLDGLFLPDYSSRNQDRIPDYHRLDLSATLTNPKKPGRKWESSWIFALYNVYARQNAYSIYFRPKVRYGNFNSRQTEAIQLSILGTVFPSVTYHFKF
ncbi:MAG: TonB-dependent receptor [Bacteroidota bacterium]